MREWFDAHPDYACMQERGLVPGERPQVRGMLHHPSGVVIGEDSRSQACQSDGYAFGKRGLGTPLSNATPLGECRSRAITLALLHLAIALRGGELAAVRALTLQIVVHQRFPEVEALIAATLFKHDAEIGGTG